MARFFKRLLIISMLIIFTYPSKFSYADQQLKYHGRLETGLSLFSLTDSFSSTVSSPGSLLGANFQGSIIFKASEKTGIGFMAGISSTNRYLLGKSTTYSIVSPQIGYWVLGVPGKTGVVLDFSIGPCKVDALPEFSSWAWVSSLGASLEFENSPFSISLRLSEILVQGQLINSTGIFFSLVRTVWD